MSLQALPFEVEYIPGTENDAADYLSRYPAGDQDLQGDTEDLHLSSDDVGLPTLEEFQTGQNLQLQQSPACLDGYSAYPDGKVLRLRRHEGTDPVWLPETLVPAVLRYYHGPGVSRHYGPSEWSPGSHYDSGGSPPPRTPKNTSIAATIA